MKLRCIIVDDESLARKLLEENVRQFPFLELIRSCKNAFEAMEIIQTGQVDLMFLDIQMPGMLGTKFLQSLTEKPLVVFVTAYSHYAVESYDLDVVDYLMKPVSMERFAKAVNKALDVFQKKQMVLTPAPSTPVQIPESAPFFFVNVEYSLVKIPVMDILYIESMKDYVKIFLKDTRKPVITKSTLKGIEEKLPEAGFLRVHRSYIVHLEKISSIRNHTIKIGESEIPVGESNLEELLRLLNYSR